MTVRSRATAGTLSPVTGVVMRLRPFSAQDAAPTAQIFYDSVRQGAGDGYSEEQRAAWAPEVPSGDAWSSKFADAALALVAEDDAGIAGFMTLMADGYLDLAYVRPDAIGVGVAKTLYAEVERVARSMGLSELTSDASHLARAFFERQGWQVVREQHPERFGVTMTNYRMRKRLVG